MELRTYTGLWNVEKRIYKFYDVNLPVPVTIRQIAVFFGFTVPWIVLMNLLNIPFEAPFWYLFWVFPPIIVTWLGNRPIAEGKSAVQFVQSQIGFFLGQKSFGALTPIDGKVRVHEVRAHAWRRNI